MDRELQTLGIDSRVDRLLVLVLGIVYQLWPLAPCSVDETGRITRLRRLAIYDWHQEFDAKRWKSYIFQPRLLELHCQLFTHVQLK
jgi:hypothetical protein